MSSHAPSVLGAILAGGRSSRMGTDKAAVVVDGAPMGASVRRALAAVCGEVVQVGGDGADVDDPRDGPLVALRSLLRARPGRMVLVAPVDQPRLEALALKPLLDACGVDDAVCWADEPLPLCLGPGALARLERLVDGGARRLGAVVTRSLPIDDDAVRRALINVNTPDDVAALLATGRGRPA